MALLGTYYLDAANLLLASRVYTDSNMTTLAPDGFYGDGTIVRQQDGGLLQIVQTYPVCNPDNLIAFMSSEVGATCSTVSLPNWYYNGPATTGGPYIPGEPAVTDLIYTDEAGTILMTTAGDYRIYNGYAWYLITINSSGAVTNKIAC